MSRPVLVSVLSVLASCCAALCATSVALAQDGVQVDPDSPPGVEYALPLDLARGQAGGSAAVAGASRSSVQPSGKAPAFGRGITPPRPADEQRSPRGSELPRESGPDTRPSPARSVAPGLPKGSSAQEAPGASILFTLLGAVAVLLAGGLVALWLRRQLPTV